jgi:hypothetical protein
MITLEAKELIELLTIFGGENKQLRSAQLASEIEIEKLRKHSDNQKKEIALLLVDKNKVGGSTVKELRARIVDLEAEVYSLTKELAENDDKVAQNTNQSSSDLSGLVSNLITAIADYEDSCKQSDYQQAVECISKITGIDTASSECLFDKAVGLANYERNK